MLFLLIGVSSADAQCAMCKMAAENGAQADGKAIPGTQPGILYLAAVPYLSFSVIAFFILAGLSPAQRAGSRAGSLIRCHPIEGVV